MLDEILKRETELINQNAEKEINSVNKNAKIEINSMKYIANFIKTENNSLKIKFKNHSTEEIYQEIKKIINCMYETYSFESQILFDNIKKRSKEDLEKSILLGFEEITGDSNVLDGYLDTGELLRLTQKGKEILNGYRLARDELTIEDYKKDLTNRVIISSKHLY